MPAPENRFKSALGKGRPLYGLWVALASPHVAELCAGTGYDWLLIDGEHGPNDIPLLASQVQAMAAGPAQPIVRLPAADPRLVRQALDFGCQTLMIPMVETAAVAEDLARASRYPPRGVRGIGASLTRATGFGAIADYVDTADDQICLILQIESLAAIASLEEIASVPDVDVLFIGPADLAADMGLKSTPGAPEVVEAAIDAIRRIKALGKPAGIMTVDPAMIAAAVDAGVDMIGIGSDVGALMKGARDLLASTKG
ncbi:HpcH/HpaI aldolase family protein [Rhizobium halophytocola]|uniref:4-hydroxy-2-oxoheptanedioate aldolase n=1 Tax=Rhizobium halophytocola TaxID=735519 RepID=A0ABS4DSU0_9HYPH|nr:aldolase/citrate lyase family protein [Rhizobium halophytocola]MBP1848754.1 4-hydroxy-2-oxoheptanedioate aldolase [Rhizobium halophytocola]